MKTEPAAPIALLTSQLAQVTPALRECFTQAGTPRPDDPDGYRRDAELRNAVALIKASARLGQAMARIKGEFQHRISVDRGTPSPKKLGSIGQAGR